MFKKNIKFLLLTTMFSTQLSLNAFSMEDQQDSAHVKNIAKKKDETQEFDKLQQLYQVHSQLHPNPPYVYHTLTKEELATIEQMHDRLHQQQPHEASPIMTEFHDKLHVDRERTLTNRTNTHH